jgi:hypothetical protein
MPTTIVNALPGGSGLLGFLGEMAPSLAGGGLALLGGYWAEYRAESRRRRERKETASFRVKSALLTIVVIGKNTATYRQPGSPFATIGEAVHLRCIAAADRFSSAFDDVPLLLDEAEALDLHRFFDTVVISANNSLSIERILMAQADQIGQPQPQALLQSIHEGLVVSGRIAESHLGALVSATGLRGPSRPWWKWNRS